MAKAAKTNNRKHKTEGTIESGNIKFPTPVNLQNNPTDASNNFTDKVQIGISSKENNKY